MKKPLLLTLSLLTVVICLSQEKFWKFENEQSVLRLKKSTPLWVSPEKYRTLSLPFDQYKTFLNTAPAESLSNLKNGLQVSLPYPDNSFKKFSVVETKLMEDALAARFPEIKTYIGQGIDDPAATVRIDYTPQGFHAMVQSPAGALFIDPYQKENNNLYVSYLSKDYVDVTKRNFKCLSDDGFNRNAGSASAPIIPICVGAQLRTYRIAISCTGEYAEAVCAPSPVTLSNTLSAIVTTLNRVNGIYQTELAVKMVLVAAEADVIYTDPDTDPYTGNDEPATLIDESQQVIDSLIGNGNYDIGHTFSTGAGGYASLGVVCSGGSKASGVTGLSDPKGDPFDVDFVSHEIGHEFGATHTYESNEAINCGGNRTQSTAFEVGSGTTIMAYAGTCGTDNIQLNSDPYFHSKSYDQIVTYITTDVGSTCPVITSTGNNPPVITMPVSNIKIPKGTPFTLSGAATDPDGDPLTYSWEQWDLTSSSEGSPWNSGDSSTTKPVFKDRVPKTSGSRTFPDMAVIRANYPANPPAAMGGLKGERLPQVARDIKFRFVARDNRATGGGVAIGGTNGCSSSALFKVRVTDDGPFKLTVPNTAVTWLGASTQTVTWNVANTNDVTGINTQNVDILMSTDGGNTYPTVIASSTPNTGSKTITVPNIPTNSSVRFMVRASGNLFFDISDVNFTILFNSVVPISLMQFSALPNGNAILLTWSTATESNNKGFRVLRSEANENNFVQIGFIAGAGNSSTVQNYSLTDNTVKKGIVYFYRLQEIDINNNAVFSDIRRAKLGLTATFSAGVQPQPFHNNADLYLDGIGRKDFKIIISDLTGRIIQIRDIKNTDQSRLIPLDLTNQAAGLYFIKILQDKFTTTIKAVKG